MKLCTTCWLTFRRCVDILPAASGEDSYGLSVCFSEMASGGSSHNRPTSAEDHEEALLLGCPPIGRLDESILCCHIQKNREGLISLCISLYPRPFKPSRARASKRLNPSTDAISIISGNILGPCSVTSRRKSTTPVTPEVTPGLPDRQG